MQNLSARAFDTAEKEFRQVYLPFLFENAVKWKSKVYIMIMSTPEHVYPARLIEKLMKNDVFGKENEHNKVPKSTASISDPAQSLSYLHRL